jgi:hypothetical protein
MENTRLGKEREVGNQNRGEESVFGSNPRSSIRDSPNLNAQLTINFGTYVQGLVRWLVWDVRVGR